MEAFAAPNHLSIACEIFVRRPKWQMQTESIMISLKIHMLQKANHGSFKGNGWQSNIFISCLNVLFNKIEHTDWVNLAWKHAWLENPSILQPEENGWTLHNDLRATKLCTDVQMPPKLCDLLRVNGYPFGTDDLETLPPVKWEWFYEGADDCVNDW